MARAVDVAPSGQQFEIRHGDHRAVATEVGAGLRTYSVGDRDVIDGYALDAMARSGRGQVLAPWPNRLEDGAYSFNGRDYRVPIDQHGENNAIHGLVRWQAFTVRTHEPARVALEHVLHPTPGYPFTVTLSVEYSLRDAGLAVQIAARNDGTETCPFGCGAHPYLTRGTPVDTLALQLPAATVLRSDGRGLPVGADVVVDTEFDFRSARPVGPTVLDHCFTDLTRGDDGLARVHVGDLTLWMDGSFRYVMVFTGDPLADVARRAIAVEPMTCPPNAFRTGTDLVRLEPGQEFHAHWGITPQAGGGAPAR